jgi:hypothetical protein
MTEAEKLGIFVLVLIGLYFLNHIIIDTIMNSP